jgi:hypothetical protein
MLYLWPGCVLIGKGISSFCFVRELGSFLLYNALKIKKVKVPVSHNGALVE